MLFAKKKTHRAMRSLIEDDAKLAKRILRIAKSGISDQLKEGEIAALLGHEFHCIVLECLKDIRNG